MTTTIEIAHNATEKAIDEKVVIAKEAAAHESSSRGVASKSDGAWILCKDKEVELRKDYDNKFQISQDKQAYKAKMCAMIEQMVDGNIPFQGMACTFKLPGETCTESYSDIESKTQTQMDALISKVEAAVAKRKVDVKNCNDATAAMEKAQTAEAQALSEWTTKKASCGKMKSTMASSVCSFQRAFEAKCAAVKEYQDLVAETKQANGTGNSDVDRRAEFTAITAAECALQSVKTDATDKCTVNQNFDSAIGTLKLQEQTISSLEMADGGYLDCNSPAKVTFSGWTYDVTLPVESYKAYSKVAKTWDMTSACTA